jgi:hypothetical protein
VIYQNYRLLSLIYFILIKTKVKLSLCTYEELEQQFQPFLTSTIQKGKEGVSFTPRPHYPLCLLNSTLGGGGSPEQIIMFQKKKITGRKRRSVYSHCAVQHTKFPTKLSTYSTVCFESQTTDGSIKQWRSTTQAVTEGVYPTFLPLITSHKTGRCFIAIAFQLCFRVCH